MEDRTIRRISLAKMPIVKLVAVVVICALLCCYAHLNRQQQLDASLILAVRKGDLAAVTMLLDNGASPNARSFLQLSLADFSGVRSISEAVDEATVDRRGLTVLMIAVQHMRLDIVRVLLDRGANVNAQMSGITALTYAGIFQTDNGPDIVQFLKKAGAR
jgi:ankyrin repeat protein